MRSRAVNIISEHNEPADVCREDKDVIWAGARERGPQIARRAPVKPAARQTLPVINLIVVVPGVHESEFFDGARLTRKDAIRPIKRRVVLLVEPAKLIVRYVHPDLRGRFNHIGIYEAWKEGERAKSERGC